jgi:hypothetical protein
MCCTVAVEPCFSCLHHAPESAVHQPADPEAAASSDDVIQLDRMWGGMRNKQLPQQQRVPEVQLGQPAAAAGDSIYL